MNLELFKKHGWYCDLSPNSPQPNELERQRDLLMDHFRKNSMIYDPKHRIPFDTHYDNLNAVRNKDNVRTAKYQTLTDEQLTEKRNLWLIKEGNKINVLFFSL